MDNTEITDSILLTVKKMMGGAYDLEDDTFDVDLIVNINTALAILNQIGVGLPGYTISDKSGTWLDFLQDSKEEVANFAMIKSWVFFKVKKLFDPAQSSAVKEANNDNLAELEWRIHSRANYE